MNPEFPMCRSSNQNLSLFPIAVFLLALLFAGCALSLPKDLVSLHDLDTCSPLTVSQLERQITLFDDTTDTLTLECALRLLRNAENGSLHKGSAGSKICFLLADRTEKDGERRKGFASEGVRWAERALAQGAQEPGDSYYYLAVNLGIAVREHPLAALKHLDRLVSSLEKAVELSPDVNSAGPYRVLGMLYLMAPPWPQGIGDGDRALELLQEAVRRYPDYPKNLIFYARALWEVEGADKRQEIEEYLMEALRLMNEERWKTVKGRWVDDLNHVARDAYIELQGRIIGEY